MNAAIAVSLVVAGLLLGGTIGAAAAALWLLDRVGTTTAGDE
jgi:hypothetical protein